MRWWRAWRRRRRLRQLMERMRFNLGLVGGAKVDRKRLKEGARVVDRLAQTTAWSDGELALLWALRTARAPEIRLNDVVWHAAVTQTTLVTALADLHARHEAQRHEGWLPGRGPRANL